MSRAKSGGGEAFLLKLRDDTVRSNAPVDRSPVYRTLAVLRTKAMRIRGDICEMSLPGGDAAQFRALVSGAGTRSVSVIAVGMFLDSGAEAEIRCHALAETLADYELSFASGVRLRARFLLTQLDLVGEALVGAMGSERLYELALERSGTVEVI